MRDAAIHAQEKRARIAEDTLDIYARRRPHGHAEHAQRVETLPSPPTPDADQLIMTRRGHEGQDGAIIARIAAELTDQFAAADQVEVKGRQK